MAEKQKNRNYTPRIVDLQFYSGFHNSRNRLSSRHNMEGAVRLLDGVNISSEACWCTQFNLCRSSYNLVTYGTKPDFTKVNTQVTYLWSPYGI